MLDAAEELFAERGYHDTGLKDVATRCELSVGTIYSLFESKEQLYETVLLRHGDRQTAEADARAPSSMPADERLIALARMQIEHMAEHPRWHAVNADAARVATRPGATMPHGYKVYLQDSFDYLTEIIEDGQRAGVIYPGDPRAMARLYFTLLDAFVTMNYPEETGGGSTDSVLFENFVRRAFSSRSSH